MTNDEARMTKWSIAVGHLFSAQRPGAGLLPASGEVRVVRFRGNHKGTRIGDYERKDGGRNAGGTEQWRNASATQA